MAWLGGNLRYAMPSGGFPGSFALPVPFVWLKPIGVGGGPGGRVWEQKGVKRHGGISPLAGLVGNCLLPKWC